MVNTLPIWVTVMIAVQAIRGTATHAQHVHLERIRRPHGVHIAPRVNLDITLEQESRRIADGHIALSAVLVMFQAGGRSTVHIAVPDNMLTIHSTA